MAYGAALYNGRERRQPHHTTFASIYRRESVELRYSNSGGLLRTARAVLFEEEVLLRVEENQFISVCVISHQMKFSRTSVHQDLQEQLLYPYHLQRVQTLNHEDYSHRLGFGQWLF